MTDLGFWVAVYVSLTVGAMAGMFIVAALHDCHRQPQRREQCRHVRLITPSIERHTTPDIVVYDWAGER